MKKYNIKRQKDKQEKKKGKLQMFIVKEKKFQSFKVYNTYCRTGSIWFNFVVFEF